jgi:hypothetical protein
VGAALAPAACGSGGERRGLVVAALGYQHGTTGTGGLIDKS